MSANTNSNPLKRKTSDGVASNGPQAKKVKSSTTTTVASATPIAPTATVTTTDEPMEDVVGGDRKKRPFGLKKKKPKRVSKHILEAQARKKAAAEEAEAKATEGKETESGDTASAAPKHVKPAHKPKAATSAPVPAAIVESKLLALQYLQQWSTARESWKFQKVRQLWLLEHVYDKDAVGKKEFTVLCEYLKELKGAARTRLVDDARKILESYQEWSAGAEQRAAEKAAKAEEKSAAMEVDGDESKQDEQESEEEQDKRKKRKAQRAEKLLSVLA